MRDFGSDTSFFSLFVSTSGYITKVFPENGSKNGTHALKNINMLCVAKRGVKSTEKKKIRITYQFKVTTLKMEWPGSYSGGKQGCCYPKTGKPAKDFTIAGLWPCYLDATIPEFCDSHSHFNIAKTSNLTKNLQTNWPALACPSSDSENKLWSHEWNQHDYFEAALRLKKQVNLLKILTNEGENRD
ncbi:ribonuclease 3-like [Camellia sinensis]|uniref:ribonuclease 3-like n=1 Tax=Camellia sinensis TaxID=4442 RepID=UPI0010356394|nr:ribonuclease 3-like [Camellia sinensis]